MDVIFDIDGTLADASHRLHYIKDMAYWRPGGITRDLKPDWDSFLSAEELAKDAPIEETFYLLATMLNQPQDYRVLFITGRKESTRSVTYDWLRGGPECPIRCYSWHAWERRSEVQGKVYGPNLFMRSENDRRPSHEVKRGLLHAARYSGFNPTLVFEDRANDAEMWRSEGLFCCQVNEGQY